MSPGPYYNGRFAFERTGFSMIKHFAALAAVTAGLLATAALASDVVIGHPAPEFELADQDGQLHSLEDYRDQWPPPSEVGPVDGEGEAADPSALASEGTAS